MFQFLEPDRIKRDKLRKIFRNGILERMVKFDRLDVQEILELGEQILTLIGKIFHNTGLADFEGKDIISFC